MTAADLNLWMAGHGDYAQGLELVRAYHAADDALMFILQLGDTTYSRRKMVEALRLVRDGLTDTTSDTYAQVKVVVPVTKADIQAERHAQGRDLSTDGYQDETLPLDLREKRQQAKALLREMDYYRHRLEEMPNDNDRLTAALIIVENDAKAVAIYQRLDAWRDTGRDPGETTPPPPKKVSELAKELRNIDSYLARHRSGARPRSSAQVKAWEDRRTELKAIIDELEQA